MSEIFLKCVTAVSLVIVFSTWAVILFFAASLIYSILKNSLAVLKTYFQVKRLPLKRYSVKLIVIDDISVCTAFTSGIFLPRIYISKGMFKALSKEELRSVFLHELHHKNQYDPLKMVLMSIVKDTFFYLPILKELSDYFYFLREKKADDSAISATAKPLELASALLKVSGYKHNIHTLASISGGGLIEQRVKRLVGENAKTVSFPGLKKMLTSILLITLFLSAPGAYTLGMAKLCDEYKCNATQHHSVTEKPCISDSQKDDCNEHCSMKM